MKTFIITCMLLLSACASSKQKIIDNTAAMDRNLVTVLAEQKTIEKEVTQIQEQLPAFEDAAVAVNEIAEQLKKPVSAPLLMSLVERLHVVGASLAKANNTLEQSVDTINNSVRAASTKAEASQAIVAAVLKDLSGVEDTKSGFLVGITNFFSDLAWWGVVLGVIILLGSLGLWPMIIQGLINFMSSGFLLFRRSKETAKLLYDVRETPTADKVDNVVTHFRTGIAGEAAWRHEKKRRTRHKGAAKPPS